MVQEMSKANEMTWTICNQKISDNNSRTICPCSKSRWMWSKNLFQRSEKVYSEQ